MSQFCCACNFVVKISYFINMDGAYDGNYSQSSDQSMTKKRNIEDADDDAYVVYFHLKQRV